MDPGSQALAPPARIASLDLVRGVAVLGILAANIVGLGQPMVAYGWPGGFLAPPGPFADELWGAQLVLVDGKFRGLFTLLFGAGLVLFHERAEEAGHGSLLLARRLAWLAAFGLLHWALLWRGDILLSYAIAGLVALPFLGWPAGKQAALGLAGYLVGAAVLLAVAATVAAIDPGSLREARAEDLADGAREAALMAGGNHMAVIAHTLRQHPGDLAASALWALFETLPLILVGMGLVRMGLFDGGMNPRRQLGWGAAAWLAGTAVTAAIAARAMAGGIGYADSLIAPALAAFPVLAATLGLLALLALWGQRADGWLARRLGDAGRCAFTNYLGASALALAVFSGWGLGLFGKLGRVELYGVMLVFWAVMLAWPGWWLARFRHGPLEWLWRCLTYGRRMPFKR